MKNSEFRKLIREEIIKVLNEATLISKGKQSGAPAEIKVDDYVRWYNTVNDRGMSMSAGMLIGKVIKIVGTKNMQVEVVSPSKDAGDIILVNNELNSISKSIKLSIETMKIIKQNLFWAFIYNAIGIPLAAGVLYPFFGLMLSPVYAGIAMSFSSVTVVLNSLRLKLKKL